MERVLYVISRRNTFTSIDREALDLGPGAGLRARARIRERFPYEMRRDGICAEVDKALQRT